MKKDLVIDNVGFDVHAMAAMSEKDFVETHLSNDAIAKWKTNEERIQWLKEAYKAIKTEAKKEEPVK